MRKKTKMLEIDYEANICPRRGCGRIMEWEDCPECGGEGTVHDCGEDTCACLDPETQDRVACYECNGKGGWWTHECTARAEGRGEG